MPDFHTRPLHRFIPAISGEIRNGQMRPRWDRLGKNQRWYLVRRRFLRKVGWGDLASADLDLLAEHLGGREAFVALAENPWGGQHVPHPADDPRPGWCWYDRPDCNPVSTHDLARSATFAVVNNTVLAVTNEVSHDPTGRPRSYRTITRKRLAERLDDLAGPLARG